MNTKVLKTTMLAASVVAGMATVKPVLAAVPTLEGVGRGAIAECPVSSKVQVFHSDKLVFVIGNGNLQPLLTVDSIALNRLPRLTELDIKIRDNPAAVADLKAKLLFFLGAANTAANRSLIRITDVEYTAVVCPKVP